MPETKDKIKKIKSSKQYKSIRGKLRDELERSGNLTAYYEDQVEQYMTLWVMTKLANMDIEEHGISIEYNNGGGQSGRKKNDSSELLLKTNQQMLKILAALGIKPDGLDVDEELL